MYRNTKISQDALPDGRANGYVSNEEMVLALEKIQKILGKKLDVLGLDFGFGASLERVFRFAPYLTILLGVKTVR